MEEIKEKSRKLINKLYNILFKEEVENENKVFIIITLILYLVIICICCFYHEAWEDEAQAWLIARDLSPLGIINQMKYEGHSCMWHFILFPFAKLGLPYESIKIITIIAAAITGYLVLKKSPFNRITKVSILFSTTFLYFMPAIVRPYSLMPLLITIISIMNKDKEKYPILYGVVLAIIANTHILMLPFAGMLFLYNYGLRFWCDRKSWSKEYKKKFYLGAIVAILGFVIILSSAVAGYFCSHVNKIEKKFTVFGAIYVLIKKTIYFLLGVEYMKNYMIIAIFTILILGIHSAFVSNKHGIIFWVTIISFSLVHIFIWNALLNQRAAMIYLFLYYYAWNYRYDIDKINVKPKFEKIYMIITKSVTILLVMISILSVRSTYRTIKLEIDKPYCAGKDMAEYIGENINKESVFITQFPSYISSVIAYLENDNYEFYEIISKRNFTFKTWDKDTLLEDKGAYKEAIETHKDKEIYIIEKIDKSMSVEDFLIMNPAIRDLAEVVYKTEGSFGRYLFVESESMIGVIDGKTREEKN